jgi:hypothetical protein
MEREQREGKQKKADELGAYGKRQLLDSDGRRFAMTSRPPVRLLILEEMAAKSK